MDGGLRSKPIEWVLDADLRNFFGSLDQEKLVAFVEQRIGDERVVRLIRRWLAAGVLEDGKWTRSGTGDRARREHLAVVGQRVPALRVRRVDPAVAQDGSTG